MCIVTTPTSTAKIMDNNHHNNVIIFINPGKLCRLVALAWLCISVLCCQPASTTYSTATKLYDDILSGYSTVVRPVLDQKQKVEVDVSFAIIAIIEVDPIKQKFVINGFLTLLWKDEVLKWNTTDYDDIFLLHPNPKQIWRPRMICGNTLEKRDLFEDDFSPIHLYFDGTVSWNPGSLFPTSCKLDLRKYPFDSQRCQIDLMAMGWTGREMNISSNDNIVNQVFYSESGEWEISSTFIETSNVVDDSGLPNFQIIFNLKRRPGFFIINIVTPIVLMSFLNILVFLIPVESGEKISYGITVLLALTVFMSIISDQVPRSSDTIPLVTIYLLVLTIISVCTVIMSILIVFCHHHEEKETRRQKATSSFKGMFNKVQMMNAATKLTQVKPADGDNSTSTEKLALGGISQMKKGLQRSLSSESQVSRGGDGKGYVNRWKLIGKHLDCISFIVFTLTWVAVTIGFMVEISK